MTQGYPESDSGAFLDPNRDSRSGTDSDIHRMNRAAAAADVTHISELVVRELERLQALTEQEAA